MFVSLVHTKIEIIHTYFPGVTSMEEESPGIELCTYDRYDTLHSSVSFLTESHFRKRVSFQSHTKENDDGRCR